MKNNKIPRFTAIRSSSSGCCLYFVAHAGPVYENSTNLGMTHFCEHLIIGKLQQMHGSLLQQLTAFGGKFTAQTHKDKMILMFTCLPQFIHRLWTALNDAFHWSLSDIDNGTLSLETAIISNETNLIKHSNLDNARNIVDSFLSMTISLLSDQRYNRSPLGDVQRNPLFKNPKAVHMAMNQLVQSLHLVCSVPNKHVDFCKKSFFKLVRSNNSKRNQRAYNVDLYAKLKPNIPRIVCEQGSRNIVLLGFKCFPHGHVLKPFLDLAIYALFNSPWSLALRRLRFEKGLVYSINVKYTPFHHTGALVIGFQCDQTKNQAVALEIFSNILTGFCKNGLKDDVTFDFGMYIDGFISSVKMSCAESICKETAFVATNILHQSVYGISLNRYIKVFKSMDYTRDKCIDALSQVIKACNIMYAQSMDKDNLARLKHTLKNIMYIGS